MGRYLIGIDLGTTNSALAYIDLHASSSRSAPEIRTFAVPQLVSPGETAPRTLLPSFLYEPGAARLARRFHRTPWDRANKDVIGEFARSQGPRYRGVSSVRQSPGFPMRASIAAPPFAVGGTTGRPAPLPCGMLGEVFAPFRRRLEQRGGVRRPGEAAGKTDGSSSLFRPHLMRSRAT